MMSCTAGTTFILRLYQAFPDKLLIFNTYNPGRGKPRRRCFFSELLNADCISTGLSLNATSTLFCESLALYDPAGYGKVLEVPLIANTI